jgi:predicted acyl esterase
MFFDIMLQPYDGPFYWERSPSRVYDKIKVPAYFGGCWHPANEFVRGAIKNYLGVSVPKKLIVMPLRGGEPRYLGPEEQVRWFDYWLKGLDNGVMDEPPIKIFVQGTNQWRYENEWPLARTKWTKFYLRTFGRLSTEPDRYSAPPDAFAHIPPTVTLTRQSIKYATSPLGEDTEVTGPIALYFYASIDTDDANWHAEIHDIDIAGKVSFVTDGWLKASHRAIDESRSKLPWLPEHLHTEEAVKPVVPGEINEYAIEIIPTSNVFRAGHQIQLEFSSSAPPITGIMAGMLVVSSKVTLQKIYRDKNHQSHLLLPVIPKT